MEHPELSPAVFLDQPGKQPHFRLRESSAVLVSESSIGVTELAKTRKTQEGLSLVWRQVNHDCATLAVACGSTV